MQARPAPDIPHDSPTENAQALLRENAELRARLAEAEETLRALSNGELDAVVVGDDVYRLESASDATDRFRRDVLAQMEDAVLALDVKGHVIYLNPAAERHLG
ncbi:MAG: PAS domain-containing protein, partial [Planctomycetota bacterium]